MPRTYKGSTDYIRRAVAKYNAKMAHIRIRTTPEEKEQIEAAATAAGLSVNKYVLQAVRELMQRQTHTSENKPRKD